MNGIKGVVLLTRFDYVEKKFGRDQLKAVTDKIEMDSENPMAQPIGVSKEYSEIILKTIDDVLLQDVFHGQLEGFVELGKWNARHLMPRYFQVYVDERNPGGFLQQMMRMRHILIGLGEMQVKDLAVNSFWVRINYGQPYLESVKLSEYGFLEEGSRLCGAQKIQIQEINRDDISVEYQIKWEN